MVNIGIEGMMLTAAFFGFMVGVYTHNRGLALVAALASGALMALLHAVLSITFRVDQIISGTVINILAVGLTGYLNRQLFATGAPPGLAVLPSLPCRSAERPAVDRADPLSAEADRADWRIVLVVVRPLRAVSHALGPAHASGRRASAGGGHGGHQRQSACATSTC